MHALALFRHPMCSVNFVREWKASQENISFQKICLAEAISYLYAPVK